MSREPTVLQIYAVLAGLGDRSLCAHIERCERCLELSSRMGLWLTGTAQRGMRCGEDTALKLLDTPIDRLGRRDWSRAQAIFTSPEGRRLSENVARYEYEPTALPQPLTQRLASRAASYLPGTPLTYVVRIADKVGSGLSEAKKAADRLVLSVLHVPALTPAMAAARSPVYDEAAMQKEQPTLTLPYWFDPDTCLTLTVTAHAPGLHIGAALVVDDSPEEIAALEVDGQAVAANEIMTARLTDIDIVVQSVSGRRYAVRVAMD